MNKSTTNTLKDIIIFIVFPLLSIFVLSMSRPENLKDLPLYVAWFSFVGMWVVISVPFLISTYFAKRVSGWFMLGFIFILSVAAMGVAFLIFFVIFYSIWTVPGVTTGPLANLGLILHSLFIGFMASIVSLMICTSGGKSGGAISEDIFQGTRYAIDFFALIILSPILIWLLGRILRFLGF